MLSKFQTTQCEISTQFEVCYCSDLTLTADKHLLNNESEMCVGPTADSPLKKKVVTKDKFQPSQLHVKHPCKQIYFTERQEKLFTKHTVDVPSSHWSNTPNRWLIRFHTRKNMPHYIFIQNLLANTK